MKNRNNRGREMMSESRSTTVSKRKNRIHRRWMRWKNGTRATQATLLFGNERQMKGTFFSGH